LLEGILTALVTPLKNGTVDLDALAQLVARQMASRVHGLVICATTGEGSSLTPDERRLAIGAVVKQVGGRVPVIVGTSRVATWSVIDSINIAADLGADAALVATPPYVRPTQDGIAAHYQEIGDQAQLPVILYNVPSRTASDIEPATVARLARHERIIGIKEASGSIQRVQQVVAVASGHLAVLSGDDPLTLSLLVAGGHGVVSTGANVVPEKWVSLWQRWQDGDVMGAAAIQAGLLGLHEALFLEANPGPVKGALHLLGLLRPELRLPLVWPGRPTIYRLTAELENLGLKVRNVGP